jgi:hypothetical protein
MCMSALEGDMDARVANRAHSLRGVIGGLATAAALRAFGSAAAVAIATTPRVIADAGVGGLSVAFTTVLLTAMVLILAWHRGRSGLPGTGPATHPG